MSACWDILKIMKNGRGSERRRGTETYEGK
jgi:hypothetical protein